MLVCNILKQSGVASLPIVGILVPVFHPITPFTDCNQSKDIDQHRNNYIMLKLKV